MTIVHFSSLAKGILLVIMALPAHAQWPGWEAHTSMRSITALAASADALWAGTTGGVFSYDPATGEISRFTTVEGLHGIDISALHYDEARDRVWIGYPDGVIDELSVRSGSVRSYRDISRATQFATRSIHGFRTKNDTLYVATAFGLVVFDATRGEVRDTYSRFGTIPAGTGVRDVLLAPLPDGTSGLWVATEAGLAYAVMNRPNLREPSAWTVEVSGLPSLRTLSLALFEGRPYVGTEVDVAVRQADGTWQRLQFSGDPVRKLLVSGDRLLGIDAFKISVLVSSGSIGYNSIQNHSVLRAMVAGPDGTLWVGDGDVGLSAIASLETSGIHSVSPQRSVIPSGPATNLFTELDVDASGSLWAAARIGGPFSGIYRLGASGWTNFTQGNTPALAGRAAFDRIHTDRLGNVWAGSEGSGLAHLSSEGTFTLYDHRNSTLLAAPGTQSFVRIGGVASEEDGTVWVTNQFGPVPLSRRSTDGEWTSFPLVQGPGAPTSVRYDRVYVDANNQKWIRLLAVGSNAPRGLLILNTQNADAAPQAMPFRYLHGVGDNGTGLPGEQVNAIVEDRSGQLWVGTDNGIASFFSPSLIFTDNPDSYRPTWPVRDGRYFFRQVYVNDMAVDAANRKWIASRTGAWLLSSEGNDEVLKFTMENSPLFSDNIMAVAVDDRSGKVYFATDRGLVAWQGDAVAPQEQAGNLFIYPNPVRVSEHGDVPPIFIDGLVDETEIRIVTVSGEVVASFSNRGGRARWDGLDPYGRQAPSGVYLVVAIGRNGEGTAYGKLVLIR